MTPNFHRDFFPNPGDEKVKSKDEPVRPTEL